MWCKFITFAPPHKFNMATVTAFIRISKKNTAQARIRFRLRDGRDIQLFHKSGIVVDPAVWDSKKQEIKAKVVYDADERLKINKAVSDRKNLLLEVYNELCLSHAITSEEFELSIDKKLNPIKYINPIEKENFFDSFDVFLDKNKMSEGKKRAYKVIKRALKRYEIFYSMYEGKDYTLNLDEISPDTLEDMESFFRNEHSLSEEHPEIYKTIQEKRKLKPRGQNRLNDMMRGLRRFMRWSNTTKRTNNYPFEEYKIKENVYGTPIYITIEERNKIYKTYLSHRPKLAIQRDIFIFQCLIGCRIGDLMKMTKDNIINNAIEYIAHKTKDGNPVTIRVPLNDIAKEILERYKDTGDHLLPFISEQKYNLAIKKIFTIADISRMVTVLDPTTRKPDNKPLNKIASSHLARRTFVGNLYKKVKDPNLVGALSGHKEGSRAFVRYRDIDEEMKTELVKMLE